jgi:MOSC domain-containing protein YiiM
MLEGELISVNVARPEAKWVWQGRVVETSIYKTPVEGPVRVGRLHLEGDQQADLRSHGGEWKAVYAYPVEHYPAWREELEQPDLSWGAFGENLTVRGLSEDEMVIGDELTAGSARFRVVQPRYPCYKLALKMRRPDMIVRFLESGRSGFYLSVVEEGFIAAGDSIRRVTHPEDSLSVRDIVSLASGASEDRSMISRALGLEFLPAFWKEQIQDRHRG